jgi:hypothetical protein
LKKLGNAKHSVFRAVIWNVDRLPDWQFDLSRDYFSSSIWRNIGWNFTAVRTKAFVAIMTIVITRIVPLMCIRKMADIATLDMEIVKERPFVAIAERF